MSLEQLQRRRSGHGDLAVHAVRITGTDHESGITERFHAEGLNGNVKPHNVHYRIQRADLVEVDLVYGRPVNPGLRLRQHRKRRHRPLLHVCAER